METRKMNYDSVKETEQNKIQNNKEQFKNKIDSVFLTSKLEQEFKINEETSKTRELINEFSKLGFWFSEKEIQKLTQANTKKLEYSMDVTKVTTDLWNELQNRLWLGSTITDKLIAMNEKVNKPFSIASVMSEFNEYEKINN